MSCFSELRNRNFYQKTLLILVPVLLQQLITVGINFLDNIMVGGFGEAQISGVAFGNQFYSLFQFVCMGLGSGATVMASQFWGAKKYDELRPVAAIALRLTLGLSVIFTLFAVLAPEAVLRIYTNQPNVILAGAPYMRLVGCTFMMAGLSSTATYLLRSTNQVRIPLISSIIAFCLNLFFNWVFIFGHFGAPRLEAVGAAVGTLIARAFEVIFIFGYFVVKEKHYKFRLPNLWNLPCAHILRTYMKYSLPVLISDTMLGIGLALISIIVGHMSEEMVAARAIIGSATQILSVINMAMAGASAVVIGNSVGDNRLDRAMKEGIAYCVIAVAIGCVGSVVLMLVGELYLSLYAVSEATLETARSLMLVVKILMPMQMLSYVTSKGILRGGGDTKFLLFGDIILLWTISIPLGALAAFVWNMSPFWVFMFLQAEYALKGLLCGGRFLSKKWIKVIAEDRK